MQSKVFRATTVSYSYFDLSLLSIESRVEQLAFLKRQMAGAISI
jgi:hypothetical protein